MLSVNWQSKAFTLSLPFTLLLLAFHHESVAESGYATRYWDGCKPHFSWNANSDNNPVKTCNIDNEVNPSDGEEIASSCDGGDAYTCWDMAPIEVSDTLSYGYAAVPGTSNDENGKCYELTFTGTGKYNDSEPGSVALKEQGKTMIVMATNIGYDVSSNQFDLLIPGGGVGIYDAFSTQLGVSKDDLGSTYGGFLAACQATYGYNDTDTLKSCVQNKCDTIFIEDGMEDLKNGCDWYVDWFEMADNPNLEYEEVSCPDALIATAYQTDSDDSTSDGSSSDDSTNDDSSNDDSTDDDSSNDDSTNDDSTDDDSNNDDSTNDDSSNDDSTNDDSANDDSTNDDSSNDDSADDDSSSDDSTDDDSSSDDSTDDDSSNDDSTDDDSSSDDSTDDDSSNDDSTDDDSSSDDSTNDDSSNDDSTNDDSSNDDSTSDDSENDTDSQSSSAGSLIGVEFFILLLLLTWRRFKANGLLRLVLKRV